MEWYRLHSACSFHELPPNNIGELKKTQMERKNNKIFIKHPA